MEKLSDILGGVIVQNAFWVFVGILAGSCVQFLLHHMILRSQRSNAKKLFRAELEINSAVLDQVADDIAKKQKRFVSGQNTDQDFSFNFIDFNYRMVDPLINSGHFHAIFGPAGVKNYFQFMNDLNTNTALVFEQMLRREHESKSSVAFLDYLMETKLPQWRNTISSMRKRVDARS